MRDHIITAGCAVGNTCWFMLPTSMLTIAFGSPVRQIVLGAPIIGAAPSFITGQYKPEISKAAGF
jgi:hypothetical protein